MLDRYKMIETNALMYGKIGGMVGRSSLIYGKIGRDGQN